jgi:DNA-binding MurR/RpiR family transcriptional regulator
MEKNNGRKISSIYSLIAYLNKAHMNSTNDQIALYLFEQRDKLDTYSLRQLSEKGYYSQSSLTRFLQNCGETNYQDFRNDIIRTTTSFKASFDDIYHSSKGMSIDAIKQDVIEKQKKNLEMLESLDNQLLFHITEELTRHERIYIIGSELSLCICNVLQNAINMNEQNRYCFLDYQGQDEAMKHLQPQDLVIVISIKERWYSAASAASTISLMKQSSCTKMLWTCMKHHMDEQAYNFVFHFGNNDNELGYDHLINLVPVLTRTYLRYKNEPDFRTANS